MAMVLNQPCPYSSRIFPHCSTFIKRSVGRKEFSPSCGKLSCHNFLSIARLPWGSPVGQQEMQMTCAFFSPPSMESLHMFRSCEDQALCGRPINRRAVLCLLLLTSFESLQQQRDPAMAADEKLKFPLVLESYIDEKEGFALLKPTQWSKIEKAGATVLFEDPESKGNNVGVVVNPVRISSLSEFGTLDIVADKLLQAEKKKPSTNDVQLIKVNERQVHGGAPLYQLEYKLDSSRGGIKRILSAVTVASKKLYILNVAYSDSSEKPLQPEIASLLEQIVNSFDIL